MAQGMTVGPADAWKAWHDWSTTMKVNDGTAIYTWDAYLRRPLPKGKGRWPADERQIVAPSAFPSFARQVLAWAPGVNLSTEQQNDEGRPDFIPADAVTHPFVFEVKGTDDGVTVGGDAHMVQVTRYLVKGGSRIRRVVLTNLLGVRVFSLGAAGAVVEDYRIDLRALTAGQATDAHNDPNAQNLAQFINEFHYVALTTSEKIDRIRSAAPWNPDLDVTSTEWVVQRISDVVRLLTADVQAQVGSLPGAVKVNPKLFPLVEEELRHTEFQVGAESEDTEKHSINDYLSAKGGTLAEARAQFIRNTAFYHITRLLLVRVWEDVGLLKTRLMDGGFNQMMDVFDTVGEVVRSTFTEAEPRYPSLFASDNAYIWYRPSEDALVDALYDLANTYLAGLTDDILGDVYQRQLSLADRKQLGQYYTPRDIIALMWDLIDPLAMAEQAGGSLAPLRVYDFATGSGGFLVDYTHRRKQHLLGVMNAGGNLDIQDQLLGLSDTVFGSEVSQFSAYLTEVNLVLQLSTLIGTSGLTIPELRIFCEDSLALHNPETLPGITAPVTTKGLSAAVHRTVGRDELADPAAKDTWFDVVVGNPPYVGEKRIAATRAELMARHPYWQQFSASHQDYLYYFLILGVSKLRQGGRFAFITTEYWLQRTGAAPLRKYLAEHCDIERVSLFREMRLFPDAPGQHNLVIVGQRITDPANRKKAQSPGKPKISIYRGTTRTLEPAFRADLLEAMRDGSNKPSVGLNSFVAQKTPNSLGSGSWAEIVLTAAELKARGVLLNYPARATMQMDEGVIANPQRMRASHKAKVTQDIADLFDSSDSGLGIFELTAAEWKVMETLGTTAAEVKAVKPITTGRNIYPYAVVIPPDHDWLIWLPDRGDKKFPANMPNLERHLTQFKPLLEDVVKRYKATRAWWSAHRPRTHLVDGHEATRGWADLAVTARWGDRKLVAGLLPTGAIPTSGMHAVTGDGRETSAAYLVGLLNSTTVTTLAETLAPSSLGQDEIQALGLPLFPELVRTVIENSVRALADVVVEMVMVHAMVFPGLPQSLKADVTLAEPDLDGWLPAFGKHDPITTIGGAQWLTVENVGKPNGKVVGWDISQDVFGDFVEVCFTRGSVRLHPTDSNPKVLDALAGVAAASIGQSPLAMLGTKMPLKADDLVASRAKDLAAVSPVVERYWALRKQIDDLVVAQLAGKGA